MLKKELRKIYRLKRASLTNEEIASKSLLIANQLLQLEVRYPQITIWQATYFHLFMSITEQQEVDTTYILQILAGKDKEVVVSKSDFTTGEMSHYLLTDTTKFQQNKYHIYEPVDGIAVPEAKIEVVFVPLLVYDTLGNRIGYGKGFYDRFLSNCRPSVLKIGLSFFEPEVSIDDVSSTDVRLDFCITPSGIHSFLKKSF